MADDKGSDLDVFAGLTKKKASSPDLTPPPSALSDSAPGRRIDDGAAPPVPEVPVPSSTVRGHLGGRGLPPAKLPPKREPIAIPPGDPTPSAGSVSLPKPTPPPSRGPASQPPRPISVRPLPAGPLAALPAPTPPPKRVVGLDEAFAAERTSEMQRPSGEQLATLSRTDDDALELSAESLDSAPPSRGAGHEPAPSVLPGEAAPDLDWDDEEEATNLYDRSHADLFGNLGGRAHFETTPDDTARRDANAAALLAGSGRRASVPPSAGGAFPGYEALPRIPAPAPVPRDLSDDAYHPSPPPPRPQTSSWAPSVPPPAQQAQSGGKSLYILIAAALSAAIAGALFYLRTTGPGILVVKVTHHGRTVDTAQVYLDGRQVCAYTPCKVPNVTPGPVDVRVISQALAGRGSAVVKGGGAETEVTVVLGQAGEEAPSARPAESQKPAGLALKTAMKEKVKVFVDGAPKGLLPLQLSDLKAGSVKLRFETAGDKYGALEKTVELKPGETLELDDLALPLKLVEVTFKLETAGATVKLTEDGQEVPLTFVGDKAKKKLDTARKWEIGASLKGHKDFTKAIGFDDGKPEQEIAIQLDKEEETAAAATAAPETNTPIAAPPPSEEPSTGTINANSLPPSSVLIDGRPHGSTPAMGVTVSAGSHTVTFKHKDYGVQSRTVNVGAGKSVTVVVKFNVGGGSGDSPKRRKHSDDDD